MFGSRYILAIALAWALAQSTKVVIASLREGHLDPAPLTQAGGMPSSHTAMVVALTTSVARNLGLGSPIFALSLVFSLIVMYDAAGVRRAAGRQAAVLNRVLDELFGQRRFDAGDNLRELLGHTPMEVLAGVCLGAAVGMIPF